MRKWGIIITLFYALIVVGLLIPAMVFLARDNSHFSLIFYDTEKDIYEYWVSWMYFAVVLSGQAILLFLSVETSFKHLKPRAHIAVSCIVASVLFALLTYAGICSLGAAAYSDEFLDRYWANAAQPMVFCGILWIIWGILFYLYFKNSIDVTTRLVSWLLRGSVLELLIAVPCHVIVRRREHCCAPIVTSFGIVTGIAVMLLCFGPSVLLLYKKRMDDYAAHNSK